MARYRIGWTDDLGRACVVTVMKVGVSDVSDWVELTGGAEPFVTEMDDGMDEVLLAKRQTTGKLTVVGGRGDLIVVTKDLEWRVRLTVGGVTMFRGWLKAESMEMDFRGEAVEFSYSVVDDVAALDAVKLNFVGLRSIGDLIAFAMGALTDSARGDETLYFYLGDGVWHVSGAYDSLGCMVDAWQWKQDDGSWGFCGDMMEDLARSMGGTLRCVRDGLAITTAEDTAVRSFALMCDADGSWYLEADEDVDLALAAVEWRGSHTMTMVPGRRYATVTCAGKEYEMTQVSADGDGLELARFHANDVAVYNDDEERFPLYWKGYRTTTDEESDVTVAVTSSGKEGDFLMGQRSFAVDEDYWNTKDSTDTGSESEYLETMKKNLSFSRVIYMVQYRKNTAGAIDSVPDMSVRNVDEDDTLVELVQALRDAVEGVANSTATAFCGHKVTLGVSDVNLQGGALQFMLSAKFLDGLYRGGKMSPLKKAPGSPFSLYGQFAYVCRLRVGDLYWNGGVIANGEGDAVEAAGWTTAKRAFLAWTDEVTHKDNEEVGLMTNKDYTMLYDGDQYVIPVPEGGVSGDVELEVIGCYIVRNYTEASGDLFAHCAYLGAIPAVAITKLSLSYKETYANEWSRVKEVKREAIDNFMNDTIACSVPLNTDGIVNNAGSLWRNGARVSTLNDAYMTGSLGDLLLARYLRWYSTPQVSLRLAVRDYQTLHEALTALDLQLSSTQDGARLACVSTNWKTAVSEVVVLAGSEIPS